jgi:CPA2 family monovalent cation:H+ antiporter-2
MLIAETEYRYQVEEDIKPFRDVLLGLFFVTVGMGARPRVVARNLPWVVAAARVPVLAKLVLIVALSRCSAADRHRAAHRFLSGASRRIRAGAARVGTTSISSADVRRSCSRRWCCRCSRRRCSSICRPIVRRFTANDWLARAARSRDRRDDDGAAESRDRLRLRTSGQNLARCSKPRTSRSSRSIPTRSACASGGDGSSVVYGDAARRRRSAARLAKARARRRDVRRHGDLAQDPASRAHCVPSSRCRAHARRQRARSLLDAGAAESSPSARRKPHARVALAAADRRAAQSRACAIRAIREERYSLFRGFFHGATDDADAADNLHRVCIRSSADRANAIGKMLGALDSPDWSR